MNKTTDEFPRLKSAIWVRIFAVKEIFASAKADIGTTISVAIELRAATERMTERQ